ncbi:MAG: hypothetical protein LC708_03095, partial [Actinobacteria bacterium]|nr:hypothetical protein [Actinomycetota bacterium]
NKGSTGNGGVVLANNATQTITFATLDVFTSNGIPLNVSNSGTVNVTNPGATGLVSQQQNESVVISNTAVDMEFASVQITNHRRNTGPVALRGIDFQNVSGTFATASTTINNTGVDATLENIFIQNSSVAASFGPTAINSVWMTGVRLDNNTGAISFGDLDINATVSGARAFHATDTNAATAAGTITVTSGDIKATGAPTLEIVGASAAARTPLAMVLNNLDSTNSSGVGVNLTSVSGTFTVNDATLATSITNPTGVGLQVVNSAAVFSFGNTVVNQSGGTGVVLGTASNGNTASITFADLDIAPDSGQRALQTRDNTGAITTTTGTISTTNAIAVEVIGQSAGTRTPLNVQFTTVSALASGGNPANGIILTNTSATGSPGGFRVLGTGGTCTFATPTCTGGRIQSTTGAEDGTPEDNAGIGVRLFNANQVFLTRMRIDNHANFAVHGTNVVGFNLDASVIDGANGTNAAFEEGAIGFR